MEKLNAREGSFLAYELMFWTGTMLAGAIGAAWLMMGGHLILGLAAGVAGIYSFVKRDEVKNEQELFAQSRDGTISPVQWSQELGNHKLMQMQKAQAADKVQPHAVPDATDRPAPSAEPEYPQNQRADGQKWETVVGQENAAGKARSANL